MISCGGSTINGQSKANTPSITNEPFVKGFTDQQLNLKGKVKKLIVEEYINIGEDTLPVKPTIRTTYLFDKYGNIEKKESKGSVFEPIAHEVITVNYTYDNSKKIVVSNYLKQGIQYLRAELKIRDGKVIEIRGFGKNTKFNGKMKVKRVNDTLFRKIYYDANNSKIGSEDYIQINGFLKHEEVEGPNSTRTYIRNTEGLVQEKITNYPVGTKSHSKYTYEFDAQGNWIKQVSSGSVVSTVVIRKIEYYR